MIDRQLRGNFFLQRMKVNNIDISRISYFKMLFDEKDVLHVGCTDWPIFNPNSNLHIQLKDTCNILDGLDLDEDGLKELQKHVEGQMFTKIEDVKNEYDYVLMPEVIEHVDNVSDFLKQISKINTKKYFISAPCLLGHVQKGFFEYADFSVNKKNSFLLEGAEDYIEEVHPDHNCWYSPYTLCNTIQKYTSWKIEECLFLEQKTMVGIICSKETE